jgi:hypothetical protein
MGFLKYLKQGFFELKQIRFHGEFFFGRSEIGFLISETSFF